ncbi:MAG: hypothetical protein N2561_08400 [Bacteroidetes bacterium]|nr:hypothetical protein [Rhodothermia bacterium]MCS7155372.1 hypothetical protein [Bacteroidota bacterium]MCX7907535.1 hypothetical protein [Bacteroidota bacterium]MDW8138529.1 hypothetical protein [Bacteroidota bacterium]MDW8284534.1 hypothetical protein [Bacteroidota bacterium]
MMRDRIRYLALWAALLFLGLACAPKEQEATLVTRGVYVLNQGNFQRGNAEITVYDPKTGSVQQNVFQVRNGRPLGDIAQSMSIIEDKGYIVVNNSHKIEVVDLRDGLRALATIAIANNASPRYLVQVGPTRAYVTNMFGNSVSVIDLNQNREIKTIPVGRNPNGIAVARNKAYVANSGFGASRTVSVIDVSTDQVVRTLEMPFDGPSHVFVDDDGQVWVVCSGRTDYQNPANSTNGGFVVIDPQTDAILERIPANTRLGGAAFGGDVAVGRGVAFVLHGAGLMRLNTRTNTLENASLIQGRFGAVGYDPVRDELYLTDVKDFVQAGEVAVYTSAGVRRTSFQAGIIPGAVVVDVVRE